MSARKPVSVDFTPEMSACRERVVDAIDGVPVAEALATLAMTMADVLVSISGDPYVNLKVLANDELLVSGSAISEKLQ